MAPPPERSPGNIPPETSNEPKENPFIRFRKYADAQIGSLLQGIIGLPSAFSKSATENGRWADFDDELRRRDEIQARQKQLKEADSGRLNSDSSDNSEGTSKEWKNPEPLTAGVEKSRGHNTDEDGAGNDIPLYSPVTKGLFAPLEPSGSPDWSSPAAEAVTQPADFGGIGGWNLFHSDNFQLRYLPFEVRRDQHPKSVLQAVQHMSYNELRKSPILRSNYSILPYLLFSPYSPIRLDEETAKYQNEDHSQISRNPYSSRYKEAFEDLLRTTQSAPRQRYWHFTGFFPFADIRRRNHQISASAHSMSWILNLYGNNLLQERDHKTLLATQISSDPSPFTTMHFGLLGSHAFHAQDHASLDKDHGLSKGPETEQEMYDRFIRWASTPSEILQSVESLNKDPSSWLNDQIGVLESEKGKRVIKKVIETQLPNEFRSLFELPESFDAPHTNAKVKEDRKSDGSLEGLYEPLNQRSPATAQSNVPNRERDLYEPKQVSLGLSERVVSTSTTTEHTTHEDGSVETNVTVWKRYADGRETTTTTNHFANPPCDENGNPVHPESVDTSTADVNGIAQKKKEEKKGWFWN